MPSTDATLITMLAVGLGLAFVFGAVATRLKLSPLVVLLAVVFWGWVWGVAGAFIAVPLTIAIVLVCREFDSTRWIYVLLSPPELGEGTREKPVTLEEAMRAVSRSRSGR